MIHLFVNGTAASAGGGLTYLRNVIPQLSLRKDTRATIAIDPKFRKQLPDPANLTFIESPPFNGASRRFLWEQFSLPEQVRVSGADVLLSAGNFAMRKCPVPQVLLSGNALYISRDFNRDLKARREYRSLAIHSIQSLLAKRSVLWADRTVAPSVAFAGDLRRWTNSEKVSAIYHGFDGTTFFSDQTALPEEIQTKLDTYPQSIRLLFVSHYNYYRNFETLFRALPLIRKETGRDVKLFLTCSLQPGENPGSYNIERAVNTIQKLAVRDDIVELGAIPNHLLHRVYRACNVYVTASYAETFAHPLVEAMACGLPVVASDLAVHREICGEAAVYFDRFSPRELAHRVREVTRFAEVSERMSNAGQARSQEFDWSRHVEELLTIMKSLCERKQTKTV